MKKYCAGCAPTNFRPMYFLLILLICSVDKDDWDDYEDDDDGDDDDDDEKGLIEANDGDVEDGAKLGHCEGDCDSGTSGSLCWICIYIILNFP